MEPLCDFGHDGYDEKEVARRRIDDEILQLKRRLHVLCSERNKLASICCLPAEVLSEIFLYCKDISGLPQIMALTISWICQHWRHLALNLPSLWNTIDDIDKDWVEYALSRSKNADLNVDLDLSLEGDDWSSLPLILQSSPQIKRFRLSLYLGGSLGPDVDFSRYPAPALAKLHLDGVHFSDNFLIGPFPLLREVDLHACVISWTHLPTSSNLRKLSVAQMDLGSSYEFLPRLHDMPNLEVLQLRNSLSLTGEIPNTTINVLNGIMVPRNTYLRVFFAIQQCRSPALLNGHVRELNISARLLGYSVHLTEADVPKSEPNVKLEFPTSDATGPVDPMGLALRIVNKLQISSDPYPIYGL
ncbi:hypothetical protein BDN72DRAFT_878790 [Pluteus cervinus]|uniref:Uncharacterized protein n=1 Tax=Pluteus cervinus TaxID=181527 RepID=A0ACD3ATH1_9AGAR|nr:hypothetical protein BDN72DRAFT_878790 [Pluteus cervinus]